MSSPIRETKIARSRPSREDTRADVPRERSQVFDQPTPVIQRDTTDLSILSRSFGSFFTGLESAAATMIKADHDDAMYRIAQENRDEQIRGTADAAKGLNPEVGLLGDRDYMEAYNRTKGINAGAKAAADFNAALVQQPFGTDPEEFRRKWVERELGQGTGAPMLDAAMFSGFRQATDHTVLQFRVNSAKQQQAQGLSSITEEVVGNSVRYGVSELQDVIRRSTALALGDEVKGRAHVLSALIDSARTPQALQRVEALLHEKNYGPQGQSFAEMFPASAAQVSEKATKEYLGALNAAAFQAYDGIEKRLSAGIASGDERVLTGLQLELEDTRSKHGGESVYDRLNRTLTTALDKIVRANVEFNVFVQKGISGGYPVDQTEVNKHQPRLIQTVLAREAGREGANPAEWTSPLASWRAAEAAAQAVSAYHAIGNDLKLTLSMAMQDGKNAQAQSNAFRFYARLANEGRDVANFMSEDAFKAYTAVQALMRTRADGNLEAALQAYNANPNVAREVDEKARNVDWPTLMGRPGDSREKVIADVQGQIRNDMAGALDVKRLGFFNAPGKIVFQSDVGQEVMADYARTLLEYQARGVPSAPEAAREATVKNLTKNYLTIPGVDGTVQIVRKRDFPAFKDGVNIGPGVHMNPATGERENTVETFRLDMEDAKRYAPGIFGKPEQFFVQRGRADVRADGGFLLMQADGADVRPVMFAPGQQLALSEADGWWSAKARQMAGVRPDRTQARLMTLSQNPEEAVRELSSVLPPHFSVERMDTIHGPVFRVFYKFHLTQPEDLSAMATRNLRERQKMQERDAQARPSSMYGAP